MKPTIGRTVIYKFRHEEIGPFNNGAAEAPAVIVRVWSDSCVNLKVFIDGPFDYLKTSVLLAPVVPIGGYTPPGTWSWPVREE